jgi:succinate dehydrogenase / fumarate reductase flavoprotein subunit
LVFGRRAGRNASKYAETAEFGKIPEDALELSQKLLDDALTGPHTERVSHLRKELQATMMENASVFRTAETLSKQTEELRSLRARYKNIGVDDKGKRFNTELMEAIELGFLLDNAQALVAGALNRQESRGAHSREDFRERDDENWLKHSMIYKEGDGVRIEYKPVTLGRYEPKPRVY